MTLQVAAVAKPTVALGKSRMLKFRTANDSNGTNGESWRLPPCGQLRIYSFHSLYSPTQKNESPTNTSICRQGKEHPNSDALFLSANDTNDTNILSTLRMAGASEATCSFHSSHSPFPQKTNSLVLFLDGEPVFTVFSSSTAGKNNLPITVMCQLLRHWLPRVRGPVGCGRHGGCG